MHIQRLRCSLFVFNKNLSSERLKYKFMTWNKMVLQGTVKDLA